MLHANDGTALRASCVCDAHSHGDACELTCPTGVADEDSNSFGECSGKGECVVSEDAESGQLQVQPVPQRRGLSTPQRHGHVSKKDAAMASTGAAIFFGVCACLLLGAAGACFMVAERRRRKIDRLRAALPGGRPERHWWSAARAASTRRRRCAASRRS